VRFPDVKIQNNINLIVYLSRVVEGLALRNPATGKIHGAKSCRYIYA
jgi:hypothetical protein